MQPYHLAPTAPPYFHSCFATWAGLLPALGPNDSVWTLPFPDTFHLFPTTGLSLPTRSVFFGLRRRRDTHCFHWFGRAPDVALRAHFSRCTVSHAQERALSLTTTTPPHHLYSHPTTHFGLSLSFISALPFPFPYLWRAPAFFTWVRSRALGRRAGRQAVLCHTTIRLPLPGLSHQHLPSIYLPAATFCTHACYLACLPSLQ